MQIPKRRHEKLMVRDESLVYLTPEGIEHLKDKLAYLKSSIANLAGEAKRTADYGDRYENAEYKEAKGKLRGAHRQILKIEDQLKRAVPIKSGPSASGKIQIGSTVILEVSGSRKTFQIVGPQETDPTHGRISHQSPLGAALLNHAEGNTVTIQIGSGSQTYLIIEIR